MPAARIFAIDRLGGSSGAKRPRSDPATRGSRNRGPSHPHQRPSPPRSSRWRCRFPGRRCRRRAWAQPVGGQCPQASPAPSNPLYAAAYSPLTKTASRAEVSNASGKASPEVPTTQCRWPGVHESRGDRRSGRRGRRGSPSWRRRGRSRVPASSSEMAAVTRLRRPLTASEPPSQKSFCTSTTISARVPGAMGLFSSFITGQYRRSVTKWVDDRMLLTAPKWRRSSGARRAVSRRTSRER